MKRDTAVIVILLIIASILAPHSAIALLGIAVLMIAIDKFLGLFGF